MNKRQLFPLAATVTLSALAACSGGGSTGAVTPTIPVVASAPAPAASPKSSATPTATSTPVATPTPAASPTVAPTTAPAAAALATAQLNGAAGFINAQQHTVYVFDGDLATPSVSTCTATCAIVWPAVPATANVTYPAPFSAIKRSDGTLQLAYSNRPLYSYTADTAAGTTAGDGINSFGAVWHIARPAGVSAPAPTPTASAAPVSPY